MTNPHDDKLWPLPTTCDLWRHSRSSGYYIDVFDPADGAFLGVCGLRDGTGGRFGMKTWPAGYEELIHRRNAFAAFGTFRKTL